MVLLNRYQHDAYRLKQAIVPVIFAGIKEIHPAQGSQGVFLCAKQNGNSAFQAECQLLAEGKTGGHNQLCSCNSICPLYIGTVEMLPLCMYNKKSNTFFYSMEKRETR
jgi:hypothetical protein